MSAIAFFRLLRTCGRACSAVDIRCSATRWLQSTAHRMEGTPDVYVLTEQPGLFSRLRSNMENIQVKEVDINGREAEQLHHAEVLVADPHLVAPFLYDMPDLRWLQSTWAGVDGLLPYVRQKSLPYKLTRFGGQFAAAMAEYVIGYIVAWERNFFGMRDCQMAAEWRQKQFAYNYRCGKSLTVGILGVGEIGSEVARCCKTFYMTVLGVGRQARHEPPSHFDQYRQMSPQNLAEVLGASDFIVNILPSTLETRGLLNGDVLQHCEEKRGVFINIGRGDIISTDCLVRALKQKWLSGAILDCFEVEPLPAESPLWHLRDVIVTPHCSGSVSTSPTQLVSENYKRLRQGEKLLYEVDLDKGY